MSSNATVRQLGSAVALSITLAYTCLVAWIARCQSHFRGDDLSNFYWAETLPVAEFLLKPSDAHLSPLHRLATLALHTTAPWNFDAALAALVVTHLIGVLFLYRLLRLLWNAHAAVWLTAWYGCNVFLGFQFLWWASASHRLPCITLSVIAIYQYWKYRNEAYRPALWISFAAFVAALGFFSKALIVPLILIGMESCELDRPGRGSGRARTLAVCSMLAVGVVASVATLRAIGASDFPPTFPPHFMRAVGSVVIKLACGVFGIRLQVGVPDGQLLFAAAFFITLAWAVTTSRWFLARWVVFASCILAINAALPLLAPRSEKWLLLVAGHPRYLYEAYFVIAIALAMLAARLTGDGRPTPRFGSVAARMRLVVPAFLLVVYAGAGVHSFDRVPEN